MPTKKNQGWNPYLSLISKWMWYTESHSQPQVISACCTLFFFHLDAAILAAKEFLLYRINNCGNWYSTTRPRMMLSSWNWLPSLLLSATSQTLPKLRRYVTWIIPPRRLLYLKQIWCGGTFGGMPRMRLVRRSKKISRLQGQKEGSWN